MLRSEKSEPGPKAVAERSAAAAEGFGFFT